MNTINIKPPTGAFKVNSVEELLGLKYFEYFKLPNNELPTSYPCWVCPNSIEFPHTTIVYYTYLYEEKSPRYFFITGIATDSDNELCDIEVTLEQPYGDFFNVESFREAYEAEGFNNVLLKSIFEFKTSEDYTNFLDNQSVLIPKNIQGKYLGFSDKNNCLLYNNDMVVDEYSGLVGNLMEKDNSLYVVDFETLKIVKVNQEDIKKIK